MNEQAYKLRVGITIGDPHGVGPELIIKTFSDPRITEHFTPIVYGHPEVFKAYRKQLGTEEFSYTSIQKAEDALHRKLNLLNIWKDYKANIQPGKASKEAGEFAFKSLEAAVADLAANKIDVLVTAPIDKSTIQSDQFNFPGHTEYLAKIAGTDQVLMFLISEKLKVGIVTGHIPLKEVSQQLSKDKILKKLKMMHESLLKDFGISKPRIAVMGLNPHAGDNGLMGVEEKEIITPAVREAFDQGMYVFGPYGADGFFGSGAYASFDAVLAMYHDQGLAPFKSIAFHDGVNFTAGLPIVRTSPDHGTAYEIAGKGSVDESSFRAAIFAACDIYRRRKDFKDYGSNPLSRQEVKESKEDKRE